MPKILLFIASFLVIGGAFAATRGPTKPPASNYQITAVVPNGGEQFRQGTENVIQWQGGYKTVAVGLVKPEANTSFDIASTGMISGWINTREGQGYNVP